MLIIIKTNRYSIKNKPLKKQNKQLPTEAYMGKGQINNILNIKKFLN